jgi:hypothetical protein
MEHFYDGQIKRYLTQFMRLMSNFSYKDAKGKLVQVPVRYGDMNRQVAQLMTKNSENIVQSAPFIACYIKGLDFARDRLQDPTFVSKVNIRERAYDENGQEYLNTQGANYTVERLMPTPFNLQFSADIWTTNTDQKLQLLEQLLVLFNPSMEIQTNNNFIDWTSLSLIELTGLNFSSRSIPQGLEQDIDIATLNFQSPIWLTTPAKVKKLGIITQIVTSMFADSPGTVGSGAYSEEGIDYFTGRVSISVGRNTLGNLGVLFVNGTAKLLREGESYQRTDTQQPGSKASAAQIVVNGVPVTNTKGSSAVSVAGLTDLPPAGSVLKIGGTSYTIESYSGDLANLTANLTDPLDQDITDGSNLFFQIPNSSPDNINIPVKQGADVNWNSILDLYPGKFTAGLSTIRFQKPDGGEIVGNIVLDPNDDAVMLVSFDDPDTLPANTLIEDMTGNIARGTIDAIIDPTTFNPRPYDINEPDGLGWLAGNDVRYLILEDINTNYAATDDDWVRDSRNPSYIKPLYDSDNNLIRAEVLGEAYDSPRAWINRDGSDFFAKANDIIQWDGTQWNVILESATNPGPTYITNSRTTVQYVWDGVNWMKSYEGIYTAGKWRLVL